MRIQLTKGVHLNVLATTQFKTTRIAVHFLAPLDEKTLAKRTLITSVLETASADYPQQRLLSAHLEEMFGAGFGIGVSKDGQCHRVTASMSLLADRYAGQPLLHEAFAFLNAVLTRPLAAAGQFDPAHFDREKENLGLYLSSLTEDRQLQASLATQRLYFSGHPAQGLPSFGTAEELTDITSASLYQAYQEMLANDPVEIVVLGDVDLETVKKEAQQLQLAPRAPQELALNYDQPLVSGVRHGQEAAPVNQAKLNLAYHVDNDLYGKKHYAALVAEELFGGSPLSFLFTNVREKASLAYYASSLLDPFRHLMMVQTGIDTDKRDQVLGLIDQQLVMVQQGEFDDAKLQVIKDGLINSRKAAYDAPQFLTRQALLKTLGAKVPESFDDYEKAVQGVTKEAVMQAAQSMQLQAVYFLHGEDEN